MEDLIVIDDSDEEENSQENPVICTYKLINSKLLVIKRSDYEKLMPGAFLNDTIIDFALNFYAEQAQIEGTFSFHLFNSFFYHALRLEGCGKVRKWVRNLDLFDKDSWMIPIAELDHWVLIVVLHPKHIFTGEEPSACMILFDSLDFGLEIASTIRQFVQNEWESRGNGVVIVDEQKLPMFTPKIPQQDNYCDCGVFVIEYARSFFDNPKKFYADHEDYPDFNCLFFERDTQRGRDQLRNILLQLHSGKTYVDGINLFIPKMQRSKRQKRRRVDEEFDYTIN